MFFKICKMYLCVLYDIYYICFYNIYRIMCDMISCDLGFKMLEKVILVIVWNSLKFCVDLGKILLIIMFL